MREEIDYPHIKFMLVSDSKNKELKNGQMEY